MSYLNQCHSGHEEYSVENICHLNPCHNLLLNEVTQPILGGIATGVEEFSFADNKALHFQMSEGYCDFVNKIYIISINKL